MTGIDKKLFEKVAVGELMESARCIGVEASLGIMLFRMCVSPNIDINNEGKM